MTDDTDEAHAVAAADGVFAAAICRIIAEAREAGRIDPEMLALEVDFALRGCYFQADPTDDDALRRRAATLLELAGGPTRLTVEIGKAAAPRPIPDAGAPQLPPR